MAAAGPPLYRDQRRPAKVRPAPLHTSEAIAAGLREDHWQTVTWREGTQEPLQKHFAAVRVYRATGGVATTNPERIRTGPEDWLLNERPLPRHEGETRYYYSNAPAGAMQERLAQLAHARWAIEQFHEDAKGECGSDDYQGRRWDGLHRHLALVMLAYSFLVAQRLASAGGRRLFLPEPDALPDGHPPAGSAAARGGPAVGTSRPAAFPSASAVDTNEVVLDFGAKCGLDVRNWRYSGAFRTITVGPSMHRWGGPPVWGHALALMRHERRLKLAARSRCGQS